MQSRVGSVWSEEETTLALYLYYLIESGEVGNRSRAIKELATYLNRSPGSVEMKIGNLQFCDQKNTKGLKNGGKTDSLIFSRYLLRPEELQKKTSEIFNQNTDSSYLIPQYWEPMSTLDIVSDNYVGDEVLVKTKHRVNQDLFRQRLLANYDKQCCLSHISTSQLLFASHIVPWSKDVSKRLDPRNGLLLNALLDSAFDKGLITVDASDYSLIVSNSIKDENTLRYLHEFKGKTITLPKNTLVWPSSENLQYHNDVIFDSFKNSEEAKLPSFSDFLNQKKLFAGDVR